MIDKKIAICSIVRDCNKNLKSNLKQLDLLSQKFLKSYYFIFENDSIDGTKETLLEWANGKTNVDLTMQDYKIDTIPKIGGGGNKFFSNYRITKMATYRNQYLKMMKESGLEIDYVLIIDLDIRKFSIQAILSHFNTDTQWDIITANGYSYSKFMKKRYHDTYALVEIGKENCITTEKNIYGNQKRWSFLKIGMPLIPVYSAFGGLAIYKYNLFNNVEYRVIENNDKNVQVKCEHFSIHKQMHENNYNINVFIDPSLVVYYQSLPILKKIKSFYA